MKQRFSMLLLVLCLVLAGCGWMDGSYVHISDHEEKSPEAQPQNITVSSYTELETVLTDMVENGTSEGVIYLSEYAQNMAQSGMYVVSKRLTTKNPLGAYAVENVEYEIGSNSGKPAIAVSIHYRHTPTEIHQVRRVRDMQEAQEVLGQALDSVDPGIVILIQEYETADFAQYVSDYALNHPQTIMEIPHVTEAVYGSGDAKVVELNFTYRSSRDALKLMRQQVEPVFEAAKLYVSEDAPRLQQYSQLYAFLMERFSDYRIQPSITPSYSLLHHGVGDCRAFAMVYEAMCRSVGLECQTINGTRNGEPWTWNLIHPDGDYGHVDLLKCSNDGRFQVLDPVQMQGYVWDYSSSPDTPEIPGESAGQPEETSPDDAETTASDSNTEKSSETEN